MARSNIAQLKGRTQVDPRDTFDYTTPDLRVSSHPVDSYHQTDATGNYNSLLKSLSGVNQSLLAFMDTNVNQKKIDFQQGQEAYKQGKELAPGSSDAMVIGYERLRGQTAAKLYEKDLGTNLKQNAKFMTQDEFQGFMNETAGKYTQGATEHFLSGFFEGGALEMEANANNYYTEVRQAQMREDTLDMAVTTANLFIDNYLETNIGSDYIDVIDDPNLYSNLRKEANEITGKTFFQEAAEQLRLELTKAQESAKLLGIPAKTVTTAYITALGENAVAFGMPELLDFAKLKDPSGISLIETSAFEKLKAYQQAATKTRKIMHDNFEARVQREKEIRQNVKLNEWSVEITDIVSMINPVEIGLRQEELKERIQKDEDFLGLPYAQVNAINNVLSDLALLSQQAPRISDVDAIQDFHSKYLAGTLTGTEVNNAFSRQLLSQADYVSLMRGVDSIEQRRIADMRYQAEQEHRALRERISDERYNWSKQRTLARDAKQDEERERRRREQAERDRVNAQYQWKDRESCMNLRDDVRRHIGTSDLGNIDNKKITHVTAVLNDKLEEFINDKGRRPTYNEYVTNVAAPVLEEFGSSMGNMLKGGSPQPKNQIYSEKDEPSRWKKAWDALVGR